MLSKVRNTQIVCACLAKQRPLAEATDGRARPSLRSKARQFTVYQKGAFERALLACVVLIHARVQEHAGNDPTTQIVPTSGGSGTWTKPEDAIDTAITSSSTWAHQQGPWQPPSAVAPSHMQRNADRMLNPEEYPSLAVAAKAEAGLGRKGEVGGLHAHARRSITRFLHQDARWADDERAGSSWRGDW